MARLPRTNLLQNKRLFIDRVIGTGKFDLVEFTLIIHFNKHKTEALKIISFDAQLRPIIGIWVLKQPRE